LKLYKSNQLSSSDNVDKFKEEEEKKEEYEEGSERNSFINGGKESEERWKEYIKSAKILKN
jgi:hypothetical protein